MVRIKEKIKTVNVKSTAYFGNIRSDRLFFKVENILFCPGHNSVVFDFGCKHYKETASLLKLSGKHPFAFSPEFPKESVRFNPYQYLFSENEVKWITNAIVHISEMIDITGITNTKETNEEEDLLFAVINKLLKTHSATDIHTDTIISTIEKYFCTSEVITNTEDNQDILSAAKRCIDKLVFFKENILFNMEPNSNEEDGIYKIINKEDNCLFILIADKGSEKYFPLFNLIHYLLTSNISHINDYEQKQVKVNFICDDMGFYFSPSKLNERIKPDNLKIPKGTSLTLVIKSLKNLSEIVPPEINPLISQFINKFDKVKLCCCSDKETKKQVTDYIMKDKKNKIKKLFRK